MKLLWIFCNLQGGPKLGPLCVIGHIGGAENDGHEIAGHDIDGPIAGHEIAGHENGGPNSRV